MLISNTQADSRISEHYKKRTKREKLLATEQHYYSYKEVEYGYRGRVYKYDSEGNKEITVWLSTESYITTDEAIDAAGNWAEEQNIDVELG